MKDSLCVFAVGGVGGDAGGSTLTLAGIEASVVLLSSTMACYKVSVVVLNSGMGSLCTDQ